MRRGLAILLAGLAAALAVELAVRRGGGDREPREPRERAAGAVASRSAPPVAVRRVARPDADPVPGAAPEAARLLLSRHRAELGLDAVPGELVPRREWGSLAGWHLRMEQVVGGVPVHGSEVGVHLGRDGRPLLLVADVFPVRGVAASASIGAADALAAAVEVLLDGDEPTVGFRAKTPRLVILPEGDAGRLAWLLDLRRPEESRRVFVDAASGEPLGIENLRRSATGAGRVFDPNPVFRLRDGSLEDDGDRDSPRLDAALRVVALPRLDGSGYLRGRFADASPTTGVVASPDLDWSGVGRSDPAFEAVMAYYHVDRAQARLQELGLTGVNEESQRVNAHVGLGDNSWFDAWLDEIGLGDGGVDDGEDADVILHEYGHAIQEDQRPGFGMTDQGAAMGEGFADFLAAALHAEGDRIFDPRVASWDATPGSKKDVPFLRRVDRDRRFPRDFRGDAHRDGQIWSRFLWDLRAVTGTDDALRLAIEAHYLLTPRAGFTDGANAIRVVNFALRNGRDDDAIRAALEDRGIPFGAAALPPPPEDGFEENDTEAMAAPLGTGEHRRLLLADDDWYRISVPAARRTLVTAIYDGAAADLDLHAFDASGGLVAEASTRAGTESLALEAGREPAEFLLRAHHASEGAPEAGYELHVVEAAPGEAPAGETRLLTLLPATTRVFLVPVADPEANLRIRARKVGGGARPDLRLTDPDGVVRVGFGEAVRGRSARADLAAGRAGDWLLEVRARDGTSGRARLKVRLR